jgi:hypothetical protein
VNQTTEQKDTAEAEAAQYRWLTVSGILRTGGDWVTIFEQRTDRPLTPEEVTAARGELRPLLESVSESFRDDRQATLTFDSVRVHVQSWAAIRIELR